MRQVSLFSKEKIHGLGFCSGDSYAFSTKSSAPAAALRRKQGAKPSVGTGVAVTFMPEEVFSVSKGTLVLSNLREVRAQLPGPWLTSLSYLRKWYGNVTFTKKCWISKILPVTYWRKFRQLSPYLALPSWISTGAHVVLFLKPDCGPSSVI